MKKTLSMDEVAQAMDKLWVAVQVTQVVDEL